MNPTVTATTQNKEGTWQNTLSNGQTITSANPNSIYAISPSNVNPASQYPIGTGQNVAPTVVSNETKKDQVTKMLNTVGQYATSRGMTSDGTTNKYADGTIAQDNYNEPQIPQNSMPIYGTVNGVANRIIGYQGTSGTNKDLTPTYFDSNSSTPAETAEEKQYNDLLNSMKASTDARTASAISSIQQKSALLKQQQAQINAAQTAGTQNALLTGGVTGQGSSSQYAPISSGNIVAAQMTYGVQKLAELDAQEQDLINQAQAAGDAQNFKLLEKSLQLVEDKRKEKMDLTKKLNEEIVKQNQKAREKLIQSSRDNALADLYSQGITDPKELLDMLNGNGGDFTLEEINKGLKNIATSVGLDVSKLGANAKEFFLMKENGELPQSILDLPTESEQLNAYLRNKAIAQKAPSITKPVRSGTLTYTAKDLAEDSKVLEASRGADNYVDPTIYQNLYKAWVANGGLLKDFLLKFPPKNYVNPANDWLPVFLRPPMVKTKSGTTSINDI